MTKALLNKISIYRVLKNLSNRKVFMNKMVSVAISALLLASILSGCTTAGSEKKNGEIKKVIVTKPANITPEEAKKRLDSEKDIILLDVRTQEEFDSGHIKDSILIPVDILKDSAESKLKDKDAAIFVYCRSGNRSTTAANILAELGYKKVYNLGGINKWPYDVEK